jgi:hypothetical protein
MIVAVSRAVMALAVRSFGDHRREWSLAMQMEFEAASEDGKPLSFAVGCLAAACRELPAHEEGRFAIASHVLALGVIVPVAALMISSVVAGFPTSYLGHVGTHGLLELGSAYGPLLNEGNQFAVPSLAILVLLFAALNLRIAWLALDCDWTRLTTVGALSAAATATLVILSAVVFVDPVAPITQVLVLTIELAAASTLMRWHSQLPTAASKLPAH